MRRKTRTAITHVAQDLKVEYHKLSDILGMDRKELIGVRTDKLNQAFILVDLAICEINEVIGRNRSD